MIYSFIVVVNQIRPSQARRLEKPNTRMTAIYIDGVHEKHREALRAMFESKAEPLLEGKTIKDRRIHLRIEYSSTSNLLDQRYII